MSNEAPPLIDEPGTPDLYATAVAGFFTHAGNVFITFETVRMTPAPGALIRREVMGRVIMPASGAASLAEQLGAFLRERNLDTPSNSRPI